MAGAGEGKFPLLHLPPFLTPQGGGRKVICRINSRLDLPDLFLAGIGLGASLAEFTRETSGLKEKHRSSRKRTVSPKAATSKK